MKSGKLLLCGLGGWMISALPAATNSNGDISATIEFNRDVRPILSDACFQCHGPDATKRKARLRLDTEEGAFAPRDITTIVPGKPEQSEIVFRVSSSDPEEHMPPPEAKRRLSASEIDTLQRWIKQGAKWQKHWAFIPPKRPAVPAVEGAKLTPNVPDAHADHPIDAFVIARLREAGLRLSPELDRTALIRRVTLDLTGLPPTLDEVNAFVADTSPHAYEKVVDRLLASPRYGERMAVRWLEAARYADTNGYQSDGERSMWRWRDWVIDAFNRNLRFDQFTIEQLAGDLLPGATLQQKIATGFNRNHRGNAEGGIVPEEYAVEYVVDRVDTTSTVWLGLTVGCARCHDHKYDPVTQREYYQLFAFFNNVPEQGRALKIGNSPPYIKSPTEEQAAELRALDQKLAQAEKKFSNLQTEIHSSLATWAESLTTQPPLSWSVVDGLQAHYTLDGKLDEAVGKHAPAKFEGSEAVFAPAAFRGQAAAFDGTRFINCGDVGKFGFFDTFTLAAWIYPHGKNAGAILSRMVEQDSDSDFASDSEGYSLHLKGGRLQVYFTKRWLDDAMRVETVSELGPEQWHHVTVTYDGSRRTAGVQVFINGQRQPLRSLLDELNQNFATKQPFRIGAGGGPANRFQGQIADVRMYDRVLTEEEVGVVSTAESLTQLAALPAARRSSHQQAKLRLAFLEQHGPEEVRAAYRERVSRQRKRDAFHESVPTTMVMEELLEPRDTFVLKRGEYDKVGEKVLPGFPSALFAKSGEAPRNRLDFARWLVSPQHPLTARVAVNYYWQTFFGSGLVKTNEDFGAQGESPTHPQLLDWLATEFVRTGWNVKAMHKLIVTSATYRQSSKSSPELLERDPDNRLLGRAPRMRLSAEMVRDQALAISGLLVEKIGGPSVKTYQPPNLWKELSGAEYVQDHGEKLWRRSLYTFWKRTSPPPTMMMFDAAGREACTVKTSRTNTPLQALALMNEVTYVEAARKLAERMMTSGAKTPEELITYGFQLATCRTPNPTELGILVGYLRDFRTRFEADPKAAEQLVSTGEAPRDERLPIGELAACSAVANLILNLDEVITRP